MEEKDLINIFINNKTNQERGITIIKSASDEMFIPYSTVYENACSYLELLQNRGVGHGNELLFQVEDIEKFIYVFWACQLGGITAVPVDVGENNENNEKIFRIWGTLNEPFILCDETNLSELNRYKDERYMEMLEVMNKNHIKSDIPEKNGKNCVFNNYQDYIALIQFSSGSTGIPKGIPITYSSLNKHVHALAKREEVTEKDITINWAPLSHNLGLISVHLVSFYMGINQYLMQKKIFVKNPLLWIDKASEHKATMIYSPNFGYNYILTHSDRGVDRNWDLSSIRIAFNGAEPINYELCNKFVKEMGRFGLKPNVMYPAYGCSESTSVISMPDAGEELKTYRIDRNTLNFGDKVVFAEEKDTKNVVTLVSVGYPVDNCEVRVCDKSNHQLPDFYIGCLQVRGENVIKSYYNNEKATKESFVGDGWFNTGDLCFRDKETIIITGREKEIIFISGQNYYPYDIERIAEKADSWLSGKTAACGIFDEDIQTEFIVVFVEYCGDLRDFLILSEKIKNQVSRDMGLYIGKIIPVDRLEKTDSGKLQRLKLGRNYEAGLYNATLSELDSIENVIEINHHNKQKKSQKEQIENNLLKIWKETLPNDNIGINDNFFDLGGSSTMLIVLNSRIEKVYRGCLSAIDFFEAPTISEQAELIFKEQAGRYTLLENRFPENFYSLSELKTHLDYVVLVQNLKKYNGLIEKPDNDVDKLVMMVNIYMLDKVLVNSEVKLNILSKDRKSFVFINIDLKNLFSFEQLADELEKRLVETENIIDVEIVERNEDSHGVVVVFGLGNSEVSNEYCVDISIKVDKNCGNVIYKINKNKVNLEVFKKFLDKTEEVYQTLEKNTP